MRILHLTKRYPNASGGDGVVVASLEQHQIAAGHNVHILTSNSPEIISGPRVTKFGLPIAGGDIDRINLGRIVTLVALALYGFIYLRKTKPDIIHSHTMDFGFAISFAARTYGIPTINTSHGISFNDPKFSTTKRRLEIWLIRHAKHRRLITVDPNSIDSFKSVGLGPVVYQPNAVDAERFKPHRLHREGAFRILYVGRLTPIKGLPVLFSALATVIKTHPQIQLEVAGEGPDLADYQKQLAALKLTEHVTFLGRRSAKQLTEHYATADAFVLPSFHEGFALVMLEAWASSLPVVITNVGSTSQVCRDGENALIVPPGDEDALAKAINRLIESPKLQTKLGLGGRKEVDSTYNYAATSQALESIYHEVLA